MDTHWEAWGEAWTPTGHGKRGHPRDTGEAWTPTAWVVGRHWERGHPRSVAKRGQLLVLADYSLTTH